LRSRALAERVMLRLENTDNIPQSVIAEMVSPSGFQPFSSLGAKVKGVFGSEQAATDADQTATAAASDIGTVLSGDAQRAGSKEFNETLKKFRDSLSINPIAKTSLVTILYESVSPEFSAMVANAFADEYIESVLDRRQALKDEVAKLASASDMYRTIQSYKNSSPQLLETLPAVQSDVLVLSVKTEYGNAQRDLSELSNRYGARHPRIIDAQSRLDSLRTTLNGHIQRVVATLENDYRLAQQQVASLQSTLNEGKQNIQLIGQQKIRLETLERAVAANRDQYENLLTRMSETRSTDGLDEANATVAENAWVPTAPVKPRKIIIVGFAVFFSLLVAAAMALLVEFLDDKVNNVEDIERRLKTKLVGVLPLVERSIFSRKKDLPLTPIEVYNESETFVEAINTCRTALSLEKDDRPQVESGLFIRANGTYAPDRL